MNSLWVLIAVLVFGVVDYVGYPWFKKIERVWIYRIFQTALQILIVYLLWFWPAVAFMVIWWTFGCDFVFYGCCEWLPLKGWPGKGSFDSDAMSGFYWAWWTPIGLVREEKIFRKTELWIQAAVGIVIAVVILYLKG
jgi:hypothetical protein